MKAGIVSIFCVIATGLFLSVSCRRQSAPPPAVPEKNLPSAARTLPPPDPKVTEAVGRLHDMEREWLARSPEAAAAFQNLKQAQADYQSNIEKFGIYATPVRNRDAKLQALIEAREKGVPEMAIQAEKEFKEASDKVEEAEAILRSGNPSIQQAYDKWVEARKAYSDLRQANEALSKASADVTQLQEKGTNFVDVNRGVKEN